MKNLINDMQNKKGRLTKREFDLSEGDDSWGFEKGIQAKMPLWEKLIYAVIIGFFAWYILTALINII